MSQGEKKIIVIGHKNPDTDSICSAISYANLKNKMREKKNQLGEKSAYIQVEDGIYEPCRAGTVNQETKFVLKYFGVNEPQLVTDVRTQVSDIEIRKTPGVARNISLKKAWTIMNELGVVTLPITKNNRLEGLITIGDITSSYMEAYDSTILSTAHTQYSNIVETLEATVIVGDERAYYTKGKVLVAAANPDLMEDYIEENDLVILGNRYESQLCAIEMKAACIIVCEGAPVSLTIRKMAEDRGCTVISTPFDTFTAARLINQSMPISYFMKKDRLITFNTDDIVEEISETMAKIRHRDFPILDANGYYQGMISRRNLLGMEGKQVILVDHNEKTQAVNGIQSADVLEIIDHHRLGTIETMGPVFFRNQPLGCTATIVYLMYQENDIPIEKHIAGLLCSAIISDTLLFRSPTCTYIDKMAAQHLATIAGIEPEVYAKEMFAAGSNLKNKTAEQVFYQDFKEFSMEGKKIGVGQISSMNPEELIEIKNKLDDYLEDARQKHGVDVILFMLTDIMEESTLLLMRGQEAAGLIKSAFGVEAENQCAVLKGVVSRKKQLIPNLSAALQ